MLRRVTGARAGTLLRDVEVAGGRICDVRMRDGLIVELAQSLSADGDHVILGRGGALLPGLHDHHCHLFAAAAAAESVPCGPPAVRTIDELRDALRRAPGAGWIRGVGYHESVGGLVDRHTVDRLVHDRPVRIQHRSGAVWLLNTAALDAIGALGARPRPAAVERDDSGRPTGRIWRADAWLRDAIGPAALPDLAPLGQRLAGYGLTGLTDASPGPVDALLVAARSLPQRLMVLGSGHASSGVALGPAKIVLSDDALPSLRSLVAEVKQARRAGRPVAVHSVTRASLLLLLAVLSEVGAAPGDRVEHAAIVPADSIVTLAEQGLTVVTQPSMVADRGDDYLSRVDARDVDDLWRLGSLLASGVPVGCSSDAPYGDPNPWRALRAARDRMTSSGRPIGPAEAVPIETVLSGFLSAPDAPGGPARTVSVGANADLVLVDCGFAGLCADPDERHVRVTFVAGEAVYERGDASG